MTLSGGLKLLAAWVGIGILAAFLVARMFK